MILHGIPLGKKNRIISPAHRVNANRLGEPFEILQQTVLIRYIGFYIAAIRRDRDKPILSVFLQKLYIRKHGRGVLGTETDHIHNGRIQAVAAHLTWIVGISDTHEALPEPVCQPFGIERRNIRPLACIDNHCVPPPLRLHFIMLYSFLAVLQHSL